MSEIWKQQHLPMPCLSTCPSICLSVHTLFLSGYLLGEVRASIVVGQLHVLLTLMNLKMPSDLKKGSTRAARVCEKQPQFVQQILPCHPWPFTSSQVEHRGLGEELFPLWFPILLNMFSKEDTFTFLHFIYTGLKTTLFCIYSESLGLPTWDIVPEEADDGCHLWHVRITRCQKSVKQGDLDVSDLFGSVLFTDKIKVCGLSWSLLELVRWFWNYY